MIYEEDESEGQNTQPGGSEGIPWWGWILLIVAVLYVLSQAFGHGSGTPPGFDAPSAAYKAAQSVEGYRTTHSSGRNFCQVLVYTEDSTGQVRLAKDYTASGYGTDNNLNHCEQFALRWVQYNALPSLSLTNLKTVHVLLFTQVRACDQCEQSFPNWQQQLQKQLASLKGGENISLQLYVWQITPGSPSGFSPADFPAGPFTQKPRRPNLTKPVPVRQQDLEHVYP